MAPFLGVSAQDVKYFLNRPLQFLKVIRPDQKRLDQFSVLFLPPLSKITLAFS